METSVNNKKCRAFTSLEQSKKLAKILPLESADMYYAYGAKVPDIMIGSKQDYRCYTMCWSLAALLDVLPYGYSSILTKSFNGKDYYCEIDGKPFETEADNPVDACYEMILKLHKLKML